MNPLLTLLYVIALFLPYLSGKLQSECFACVAYGNQVNSIILNAFVPIAKLFVLFKCAIQNL